LIAGIGDRKQRRAGRLHHGNQAPKAAGQRITAAGHRAARIRLTAGAVKKPRVDWKKNLKILGTGAKSQNRCALGAGEKVNGESRFVCAICINGAIAAHNANET
jgi:hypothetical protein